MAFVAMRPLKMTSSITAMRAKWVFVHSANGLMTVSRSVTGDWWAVGRIANASRTICTCELLNPAASTTSHVWMGSMAVRKQWPPSNDRVDDSAAAVIGVDGGGVIGVDGGGVLGVDS